MSSPWDLQVGIDENTCDVGLLASKAHSGRTLRGLPWYRPLPSLGLFTVATTPPWCPARAAATAPPPDSGTYLNGLAPVIFWMRSNSASSSCLEPVPATTSESCLAAVTKSCAVFHGLSSLTHR